MSVNSSASGGPSLNPQKKAAIAVLASLVIVFGVGMGVYVFPSASDQGYAPEQPIPYSHKLHAGDLKIACQYCHVAAEKSQHATVPGVGICMNCHSVVKTDSPWIQMIQKAYESGEQIEWVRIHNLPDHAHFTHDRHVNAGVSCQTCHGPIQEMEKVYQYAPLDMGWCINCHRGNTTPGAVKAKFSERWLEGPNWRNGQVAPTNCATCHY